ncbi:tRNA(Ile)(2)-agmatinylcytidine synthase [Halarchaeum nitratireducens]|uniref:tRNA(Ile2) 2-agmatinylcytidine synthetase TiaS n=1 Tax=Halarchaeum nitratireducens TaxID=489913 RepID=A0A830G8Z1_9EURY|nr:tRNA(Ile)(2)-agmatinylcytidine synthase [Halarchaeum nitratireducens]GGN13006.1 tRNA(Ile2) 2-agmatinylcytidine synthetase [Halarchaeum nitratireducens]
MTTVGIDDTDSRTRGMCTTYVAHRIATSLEVRGHDVARVLLVRLNPAVEHKTRGNAALALHTDAPVDDAFAVARDAIADAAEVGDDRTNPGLVVAPGDPAAVPDAVADFAREAVRDHHGIDDALARCEEVGYRSEGWKNGRGRIGALAAVGAWRAFDGWTYERIAYREPSRWGRERDVEHDSVFAAADAAYPTVWDTVDRAAGETVCVPHTPGPILYGIRGDDPAACRDVAARIEGESIAAARTFVTNQGTDAHLRDADALDALRDGRAYRVDGTVTRAPETERGGHVFFAVEDETGRARCAAFEPTKRFRDRVRDLRVGDEVTLCGEVSDGTLKLEKFALRERVTTARTTPTCPDCGRTMESAGATQGYRCRDCGTSAPGKVAVPIERDLDPGWYEVPPRARRHIARPLVRGSWDAPTRPER